ncbi:MAG: hypothetical protein AAGJ87_13935 [Pseudomonadota bacterium]
MNRFFASAAFAIVAATAPAVAQDTPFADDAEPREYAFATSVAIDAFAVESQIALAHALTTKIEARMETVIEAHHAPQPLTPPVASNALF